MRKFQIVTFLIVPMYFACGGGGGGGGGGGQPPPRTDPCPGVPDMVMSECGCNPVDTRLAAKMSVLSEKALVAVRKCGGFGASIDAKGVAVGQGKFWACISAETENDSNVIAALRSIAEQAPSDVDPDVMKVWRGCYKRIIDPPEPDLMSYILGDSELSELSDDAQKIYLDNQQLIQVVKVLLESEKINGDQVMEYLKMGSVSEIASRLQNNANISNNEKANLISQVEKTANDIALETVHDFANTYGYKTYALAADNTVGSASPSNLIGRPLYILDTDLVKGIPTDKDTAVRMYTDYAALKQGDSTDIVKRKLALQRSVNVVKNLKIWIRTDIPEPSKIQSFNASPKVTLKINEDEIQFQREIHMIFLSKNASESLLSGAIVSDILQTGNGILLSRLPINDARLKSVSLVR